MSDLSWLSRSEVLIGKDGIEILQKAHVLVVGLGGVGSYAAEFICRSGVGEMTIVDGDVVDPTNRNRQLPALFTTHGVSKAEWMRERLLAINPELKIHVINEFLSPTRCKELMSQNFDYVMDCIDSISPKLTLIAEAYHNGLKVVTSMGAGGKTDPTKLLVTDLLDTHTCKLAHYIRKRVKKLGVDKGIRAVFSSEDVDKESLVMTDGAGYKQSAYGTISYLPSAFGGVAASVVIRDLLSIEISTAKRPKYMKSVTLSKVKDTL